jgi:hypothetical protein
MAADRALQHRVADPVHLRHGKQHQSEQDSAGGGPQPRQSSPQAIGEILT